MREYFVLYLNANLAELNERLANGWTVENFHTVAGGKKTVAVLTKYTEINIRGSIENTAGGPVADRSANVPAFSDYGYTNRR